MKRFSLVVLTVVVSFLLLESMEWAFASPEPSFQNGDIDGNGVVDLEDAVQLLRWVNTGDPGDKPVETICPDLQWTGAVDCFDEFEATSNDPICDGQAGEVEEGCLPEGRFVDNSDGTISDLCTGLMWRAQPADNDGFTWREANLTAANSVIGGHTDWRLPTMPELLTLVRWVGDEFSANSSNSLVWDEWVTAGGTQFDSHNEDGWWTSTTVTWQRIDAWYVDFKHDSAQMANKVIGDNNSLSVRRE